MSSIETAESFYSARNHPHADNLDSIPLAERAILLYGAPNEIAALLAAKGRDPHPTVTVNAIVNHGRWLVECPQWDPNQGHRCGGAQYTSPDDPRFFCKSCLNASADGRFLRVNWPTEFSRKAVEKALIVRPERAAQKWKPGETAAELRAMNAERGL